MASPNNSQQLNLNKTPVLPAVTQQILIHKFLIQFLQIFHINLKKFHFNHHRIQIIQIIVLLILSNIVIVLSDCPHLCECKWKSGKESVLCLNVNLTNIPLKLDSGTQILDLTGNDITVIEHDIFANLKLLNLQKIYLSKCRLRLIERYAFRNLSNLIELDLSYNQLTMIPSHSFDSIPELREIKLNGNPIQRIVNDAFARLPQLFRLELSDCKIYIIEMKAFAGLESSLGWLKLDGNKLIDIIAETLIELKNLHGLELGRNYWNCSCRLRTLREWMLRENIPYGIPPICRTPNRLYGKSWDKIDLDEFACLPQILTIELLQQYNIEGNNITMNCLIDGIPLPNIRWYHKNRIIANFTHTITNSINTINNNNNHETISSLSTTTTTTNQGRKIYIMNLLKNSSNLTIVTADIQDAGIYTCMAENKAGRVEASISLNIIKKPSQTSLSVQILLICIFIALVFVVSTSFIVLFVYSLRKKRTKLRIWRNVPTTCSSDDNNYEKIEMNHRCQSTTTSNTTATTTTATTTTANNRNLIDRNNALIMNSRNFQRCIDNGTTTTTNADHHNYISEYHLLTDSMNNCDDHNMKLMKTMKKNGDYCNLPTTDHEDSSFILPRAATKTQHNLDLKFLHKQQQSQIILKGETDLHIPRLIDISCSTESGSSSVSSQVDAAALRLNKISSIKTYSQSNNKPLITGSASPLLIGSTTTTTTTTNTTSTPWTKLNSKSTTMNLIDQPPVAPSASSAAASAHENEITSSIFCSSTSQLTNKLCDLDQTYPDLLDVYKYHNSNNNSTTLTANALRNSKVFCTLPRKYKNFTTTTTTAINKQQHHYRTTSDSSQSPLLLSTSSSINDSKYNSGSIILSDISFSDFAGRRFSAESYTNYPGMRNSMNKQQRSNSFLNLMTNNNNNNNNNNSNNCNSNTSNNCNNIKKLDFRNPSLPSSPVHEIYQNHYRGAGGASNNLNSSSAATPLLDFSSFMNNHHQLLSNPTANTVGTNVNAYDYHAAQLERFLEEYRNLQDQLCKMKETCDSIRKKETPSTLRTSSLLLNGNSAAQFADPLMFNAAISETNLCNSIDQTAITTQELLKKHKIGTNKLPEPPPYWLHRNAMLKRLNDSTQSEFFQS